MATVCLTAMDPSRLTLGTRAVSTQMWSWWRGKDPDASPLAEMSGQGLGELGLSALRPLHKVLSADQPPS